MERTEPSLIPEWLKSAGVNGNGSSTHHVQASTYNEDGTVPFSRQRNSYGGFGDHDPSRHMGMSDKISYVPFRKAFANGEKETYEHARRHFNFHRASSNRSFEGVDRERGQWRDLDWDREREHILDCTGFDHCERLDSASFRSIGAGNYGRYEVDFALRRSQSMGLPVTLENGEKKITEDTVGLSRASSLSGSSSSSAQRAAFDRNFPSLGSQDRLIALPVSGENVVSLSPRPLRPSTFSKSENSHVLSSGSSASGCTSDISASTFTGVSNSDSGKAGLVLTSNGIPLVGTGTTETPAQIHTNSSLVMPKMADALVQNPPRVRSPPQVSLETQRLEELALKQSRQLIPMTPSLPKTMGSRDKSKTKLLRNVDVAVSNISKLNQIMNSSHLANSMCRPSSSTRPDILKVPQGKLLVRKTSKEATVISSPRPDPGASTAPAVSATGSVVAGVASVAPFSINLGGLSGKPKQHLDRRTMNITHVATNIGVDWGTAVPARESVVEDKRALFQAQNRINFFNALRKKAAINSISTEHRENEILFDNCLSQSSVSTDECKKSLGDCFELESEFLDSEFESSEILKSSTSDTAVQQKTTISNVVSADISEAVLGGSVVSDGGIAGTSEEEAAFLRSLGWEESTEEGEALTEEEINAFYKEHMRSMTHSPSLLNHKSQRLPSSLMYSHAGSIGTASSGHSSSSDSDDEPHVRRL